MGRGPEQTSLHRGQTDGQGAYTTLILREMQIRRTGRAHLHLSERGHQYIKEQVLLFLGGGRGPLGLAPGAAARARTSLPNAHCALSRSGSSACPLTQIPGNAARKTATKGKHVFLHCPVFGLRALDMLPMLSLPRTGFCADP